MGGDAAEFGRIELLLAALGDDIAGIAIDDDGDAGPFAVFFFRRQLEGGFDAGEDDFAVDVFQMLHLIDDANQVGAFHACIPVPRTSAAYPRGI